MAKKSTIIDGGPSLFENTPPTPEEKRFNDVYNDVLKRRDLSAETGLYSPFVTEQLRPRAEAVWLRNAEPIRNTLTASGVSADTVEAVTTDYITLLCGPLEFTATPQQMIEALKHVNPFTAFTIDRYGLYLALFLGYSRYLAMLKRYQDEVLHDDTATKKTKADFLDTFYLAADAKAICWLIHIGRFAIEDWKGFEPSTLTAFIERQRDWAAMYDYTTYYLICKYLLLATQRELEGINQPPIHSQTPIIAVADDTAKGAEADLQKAAVRFTELAAAEQAAKEKAEQAAKDWKNDTNAKTIQLHETPSIICSRPVEISPYGEELIKTIPIQRYIEEFTTRNPDKYGVITPATVQKVVEAVNLLPQFFKSNPTDGQYIYRTTINEFSEICGYSDANQDQQKALLGGLLVISDLYFVVNRPYKVINITNAKGREIKRTVGGPTTTRLVAVDIENTTGGLIIKISPDVLKGKPTLVSAENFNLLRGKSANNLSKSRFIYQTLTKGHKAEDDLVSEVFGYDEKIKLSQGDAEATKRAKTYIQNHRSDDRRKVRAWFDEFMADGLLSYTYNTKTQAYSWERLDTQEPAEIPEEQEPQQ